MRWSTPKTIGIHTILNSPKKYYIFVIKILYSIPQYSAVTFILYLNSIPSTIYYIISFQLYSISHTTAVY